MATPASPFLTASIASHIEDVFRPRRNAWLGLSSMLTATSVCMTREAAFNAGYFSNCSSMTARLPNRRNSVSGCRVNEIAAPGMTTDAPTSPPMASSAIRTFCGINVPETTQVAARIAANRRAQPAPGPGGDNSVSRPRDNLLTTDFCPEPRHQADSLRSKKSNYFKSLFSILKATSDQPAAKC
jgi:hypothetical protein